MKDKSILIFIIVEVAIIVLAICLITILPIMIDQSEARSFERVRSNMESIYTSAVIVDEVDVGLHEDSDGTGKYERLSELSGIDVYNSMQRNEYSVIKNYNTGEISVHYGEAMTYPEKTEVENVSDNIDMGEITTEDLFDYDETGGIVVITGFSEVGANLLDSNSVIQLPTTYKGRDVSGIADRAFYSRNIMGTVIIPENIKVIGSEAFSNNGIKGVSGNITEQPYAGSWQVDDRHWTKVNE